MKKLEQLKKQAAEIRIEIDKIEEKEINKVQKPRLKEMVGQCFVYNNNCHSCAKQESDYWDVFKRILEWIDTKERGFHFIVEEFSVNDGGEIHWEITNDMPLGVKLPKNRKVVVITNK